MRFYPICSIKLPFYTQPYHQGTFSLSSRPIPLFFLKIDKTLEYSTFFNDFNADEMKTSNSYIFI